MEDSKISNQSFIKMEQIIRVTLAYFDNANDILKEISFNNNNEKPLIYCKEDGEKYTEGDWVLQKYFEEVYSHYFPFITIIGEEDTSFPIKTKINYQNYVIDQTKGNDIINNCNDDDSIDQTDLTVYIDPID